MACQEKDIPPSTGPPFSPLSSSPPTGSSRCPLWGASKRMADTKPSRSLGRKILRITLIVLASLIVLVAGAIYALTLPSVQQKITRKAESFLQGKLKTRVEIGAISLRFPYYISLEKFLLEDQKGDTLARVGSLVVDMGMWKLLDQTIELQKITLEDASVYLQKKDSIFNFDFIVKAFAADTTKATPVDTTASPWKIQLNLAVLQLKSVDFLLQDEDAESTTQAKIGMAKTVIEKADLKTMNFELDGFSLSDSDIRLIQKKPSVKDGEPATAFGLLLKDGDISRSHIVFSTTELGLDATLEKTTLDNLQVRSANDAMAIHAKGIKVENSLVAYRDPLAAPTPGHVNAGDLGLTQLNADVSEFSMQNDTMFVQADAVSGNDKSGLQLHSLRATARVTPGGIEIKNTAASLNQTTLDADVALFKNVGDTSFNRMQIQLRQVKGVVGDLIVLLPPQENQALSKLATMPYEVSGNLNGWLDNLQTENVRFQAGTGTVANLTGSLQRITEPTKLSMSLNISQLKTNRTDLVRFMSLGTTPMDSILAQPLPAYVNAAGFLSGNMSRLQLSLRGDVGALQTGPNFPAATGTPLQFDLGGVVTNASDPNKLGMDLQIRRLDAPQNFFAFLAKPDMELPDMLQTTGTLRGTLAALNADLKMNAVRGGVTSKIAFNGLLQNVNAPDKLGFDVTFNANLARQEILGYVPDTVITNVLRLPDFVQIDGQAKGTVKDAAGKINLGLGNLGQMRVDGTLRDSTYAMNLLVQNLMVSQLAVDTSLRPLKTIGFTAQVNGEGFQVMQTAKLQLAGKFDSVIWDNLILRDLTLAGNVDGKRFNGEFQSPDERAAVHAKISGDFSTAIPLLETDISLNCVDLRQFGWANRPTTVCMHILTHSEGLSVDTLTAQVKIEDIDLQYDTVHIRPGNLALDVKLDNRHNNIQIASDWLQGEIKGYFALADLSTTMSNIIDQYFAVDRTAAVPPVSNDSLSIQLRLIKTDVLTTGLVPGLSRLDPVNIEASLIGQRNYFNLIVQAPRIVYQEWDVDSLNVRSYAGDTAALFVLTTPSIKRGDQGFIENALLNGQFRANVANVSFQASDSTGRARFLLAAKAALNGANKETVVMLNPRQVIDFKEWTVDPENRIRIATGGVEVRKLTLTGDGQSIKIDGATHTLAGNKMGLDFAVDIDRLNYNNFDIFVAQVLSDLGGWAEAHLKINGNTDAPQVRGKVQLHETHFTPVATNVRYELSETPIEFTESGVSLDGLSLRDPYGKTLEINGKLVTNDWKDIKTNLRLHADRWQVLSSTKQQNPVYYGELYVSMDGRVRGPLTQPDVQVTIKTAKESNVTYVYDAATQSLQHEGIVYFIPPPRQYVRPAIYDAPVTKNAFTLSASVEIDSNLTINSVINPVTGDDFRGKADGRLQLDMLANGTMTLSGRVELLSGVYNYSYQSVVKRSFEVARGSTITWTGDVRTPELALKAQYEFKASPYPLVTNQLASASQEETAQYRKTQVFLLQTTVNGSVTEPNVSFQFIYPASQQQGLNITTSSSGSDLVVSALSNVNQDANQLSKQVFGVLLLRNFINDNNLGFPSSGGNPLKSGLSSFLTGQLNALADQYLTFIDIDLTTTEGSTNKGQSNAEGTTNYQLRLQKSFFEDRLTFKLSGGTSVGGSNGDDVHSALENASVEYSLTPNGAFRVTVFSERGFELLNSSSSNLRNSGAGLLLAKEFGGK